MVAALPGYGSLLVTWYFAGWGGPELYASLSQIAFFPIVLFSVAATFRAARVASSPATRRAWAFIGLAFSAYAFGNLAWAWMGIQGQEIPFPSIADIGFLAFFPLVLLGLGLLPRERSGGTVAEGVEKAEQRDGLRQLGCGLAQGYLFGRPSDPAKITAQLTAELANLRLLPAA